VGQAKWKRERYDGLQELHNQSAGVMDVQFHNRISLRQALLDGTEAGNTIAEFLRKNQSLPPAQRLLCLICPNDIGAPPSPDCTWVIVAPYRSGPRGSMVCVICPTCAEPGILAVKEPALAVLRRVWPSFRELQQPFADAGHA
jgi:hypothetical protein